MALPLAPYRMARPAQISTPALLIYPDRIEDNISAALRMMHGDASRWRPHLKTAKLRYTIQRMVERGVTSAKCATTLELKVALEAGMEDVVVAFPLAGANAARVKELAALYRGRKVSVIAESAGQVAEWRGSNVGIFADLNPGMDRTGMAEDRVDEAEEFARYVFASGLSFRGLHHYDGHIKNADPKARELAHSGYRQLLDLVNALEKRGIPIAEVITSGTPAMPHALAFPGFTGRHFLHRVSPGTIIYNDRASLKELPGYGFVPAALVLTSVISHPKPGRVTCNAGHKAVSADAGVPTCEALGRDDLTFLKPSEEHLPIDTVGSAVPARGEVLYLLPSHVCPTVNNFDEAVLIRGGEILRIEPVSARGRELLGIG